MIKLIKQLSREFRENFRGVILVFIPLVILALPWICLLMVIILSLLSTDEPMKF